MVFEQAILDRFWRKVDKTSSANGCWLWLGSCIHNGYGQFSIARKLYLAHRFIYQVATGRTLPAGILVCHTCDVRNCCNPSHLFEGTHQQNMDDAKLKKRMRATAKPGVPRNTLQPLQVSYIKALLLAGQKPKQISPHYGVSPDTVRRIKYGTSWANVAPYQFKESQ